jgi:hypothetical protein
MTVVAVIAFGWFIRPMAPVRIREVKPGAIVVKELTRTHKWLPPSEWGFDRKRSIACGTRGSVGEDRWVIGVFEMVDTFDTTIWREGDSSPPPD